MGYDDIKFPAGTKFTVTGGAGFIGSNLCEAILKKGCKVICLDDFSRGRRENIKEFLVHPDFQLLEGDIRNFDTCMEACENSDFVLHQAAWGSVPASIEMPLIYEEINIKGTLNMMEAAKRQGVKSLSTLPVHLCTEMKKGFRKKRDVKGISFPPMPLQSVPVRNTESYIKAFTALIPTD